jgi:sugar phosphate isomerase/epimerase
MKVSIRASLRPTRGGDIHPLKWAFEEGSKLGFDGLELCMEAGAWSFDLASSWTQKSIEEAKSLCQQYGMSICSLSSDWAWAYASFFPKLKDWGRGVELIADDAKLAREVGAHTILVHFATSKGSWEDCRALLKDVAAAGEESGVALGYEANIWERLGFGGLDSLCRMTDEVGNPYFGVYLHNAYPRAGLPLHEEVEKAGKRLVKAMHSSSLTSGRVEIEFEKAFAAMKDHFADGVYTFEVSWEQAAENKKLLDEMIAKYW